MRDLRGMAIGLLGLAAFAISTGGTNAEPQIISIETGSKTGVYYLTGGTLCGLINAERWRHGIRCLSRPTDGSIDNLRSVRSGRATFGIVQSDWQHDAVAGQSMFEAAGPDRELRALFSMFSEPLTIVAARDAPIAEFDDLRGRRVSVGPEGSGGRATMTAVMEAIGWEKSDFAYVSDLPMDALSDALCDGDIDAAVFTVAHPNLSVDEMITDCGVRLVSMDDPRVRALVEENMHYVPAEIPVGTYPGQHLEVRAFAVRATLVTSSRTSPSLVETLVSAVFGNLENLRDAHPAFAELSADVMVSDGLTAPLHAGAQRYYYTSGLLPAGQTPE
ncbi:MAG: TAXI family TRAP transporter solute-binding subunit [Pseudomonadota bacterium]